MLKNDLPSVWRRIKLTLHMLNHQLAADIEELYRLARRNRMLQLRAYDDILDTVRKRRRTVAQALADDEAETPQASPRPADAPPPAPQAAETPGRTRGASRPKAGRKQHRGNAVLKGLSQPEIDRLRLELLEARAKGAETFQQRLAQAITELKLAGPRAKNVVSSLTSVSRLHRRHFLARTISGSAGHERRRLLKRLAKLFSAGTEQLLAEAQTSPYWAG